MTLIINGEKYVQLYNDNNLKMLSLEDNVYFTLRDIFLNVAVCDFIIHSSNFNDKLTDCILFEERNNDFQYTSLLNNKTYIKQLYTYLCQITKDNFEIEEEHYKYNSKNYIKLDDWWCQFENLKNLINEKNNKLQNA